MNLNFEIAIPETLFSKRMPFPCVREKIKKNLSKIQAFVFNNWVAAGLPVILTLTKASQSHYVFLVSYMHSLI